MGWGIHLLPRLSPLPASRPRLFHVARAFFWQVLHGDRGRHRQDPERGARWHRPHVQPGPQHPLTALRLGAWMAPCGWFPFYLPSPGRRAPLSLSCDH